MTRIRVAHLITRLVRGGAQENTLASVHLADQRRYDVTLIAGPPLGAEGSLEPKAEALGVPIVRVPDLVRPAAPLHDLRALAHLTRLLRAGNYDIVHTHTSKAGILGREAARRAGVRRIVHTPHGNVFSGYFGGAVTRLYIQLERRAARFTDLIIELTPRGIEEHLAQRIGRREQFRVLFSGIDLAPYAAARADRDQTRAKLGIPPGATLAGAVGRLEPVKGFPYFVDAARELLPAEPGLWFIHAGTGTQAAELAARAPAEPRFRFLGHREDIPQLLAACDMLVVPSLNEGMGRVVLEAGAAGIPVVATHVGGLPDVVEDGHSGLLVPPRDVAALVHAVRTLHRDTGLRARLGHAARAKVVPHYGLERMVQELEAIYEELLHAKP